MVNKVTYIKFREWLKTNYTDSIPADYEWQTILDEDNRFDYHSQFEWIDSEIEEEIVYNSPYQKDVEKSSLNLMENHTS